MKIYASILITLFFVCEIACLCFLSNAILYPKKYENFIIKYSQECDLSPSLVASIINVESRYNPKAKSNAGAIGLMQLMPDTANYISKIKDIKYANENDLLIPEKNIKIGCYYYQYLLKKFDDVDTALCAYNAGETTVKNWLKNDKYSSDKKTLKNIPYKETRNYIIKINKNIKKYKKYYK